MAYYAQKRLGILLITGRIFTRVQLDTCAFAHVMVQPLRFIGEIENVRYEADVGEPFSLWTSTCKYVVLKNNGGVSSRGNFCEYSY
jgi:hypothetical protein